MQSAAAVALIPILISFAAYIAAVTQNAVQRAGQPSTIAHSLGDPEPNLIT